MPLRNRVTPFGELVAIPERGTMLGNRGILHDERREIVRTSHVRRWICCVLEFKGIRRTVMKPRSYTELFFLDEATALAAGHRPCFECRRRAALDFQSAWVKALGGPAMADDMDRVLSVDRRVRGSRRVAVDHRDHRVRAAAEVRPGHIVSVETVCIQVRRSQGLIPDLFRSRPACSRSLLPRSLA